MTIMYSEKFRVLLPLRLLLTLGALFYFTYANGQSIDITTICNADIWPQNFSGYTGKTKIGVNDTVQVVRANNHYGNLRYEIFYNGVSYFITKNDADKLSLIKDGDPVNYWKFFNLRYKVYGNLATSGQQYDLRAELEGECLEFERRIQREGFLFNDGYLENYLQSVLNSLYSKQIIAGKRQGELNVRVLKSSSPNITILPNGTMYVNVGFLSLLRNEEELKAVMLHEIAHFVLDHSIVNLDKIKREEARLTFWSSVATMTAAATEFYFATKHDVFFGGNLTYLTALSSVLYSDAVLERMGIQYTQEQEQEADECATLLLQCHNVNPNALLSVFNRLKYYYTQIGDFASIEGSGSHPSLQSRINRFDEGDVVMPDEPSFQARVSLANSYAGALEFYENHYFTCVERLSVNIRNNTAEEADYVLSAMALSKLPSVSTDSLALAYLNKAESLNVNPVKTVYKQKALTFLRLSRKDEAITELKKYIATLQVNEEDNEIEWAKNMVFRAHLLPN